MSEPKLAVESGVTVQSRGNNPAGITPQSRGYNLQDQFDHLQKKLVPLWKSIECFNQDPQTIIVVPSMSVDLAGAGAVVQAYEERFLFLLLLCVSRGPGWSMLPRKQFSQPSSIITSTSCLASSRVMRGRGCF